MKALFLFIILQFSVQANHNKSLCDYDQRTPSFDSKVGRIRASQTSSHPCTATLIGENCLITAGHCQADDESWIVEFDVPASDDKTGKMNPSSMENLFHSKTVYGRKNAHHGKDWMVFSVKKNVVTGNYPGQERGFYEVADTAPFPFATLSITGYGLSIHNERRNAQQSSTGRLVSVQNNRQVIQHRVDTSAGNSGSSIIELSSGKIVGIHSHGGCRQINFNIWQGNVGTLIPGNEELNNAIHSCLKYERSE
jgi:V8-like Glu-specific endopeptidase